MSKKLNGNGRWESSRMILPEHRAQFIEQHRTKDNTLNPRVPTKEELELIRSSVILPMILSIAEKNRQQVERSEYTFKPLFHKAILIFINAVSHELTRVKRELKRHNIKVFEDEQIDLVLYFRFICRGYEERFGMVREIVRAEISTRITQYIRKIFQDISSN